MLNLVHLQLQDFLERQEQTTKSEKAQRVKFSKPLNLRKSRVPNLALH